MNYVGIDVGKNKYFIAWYKHDRKDVKISSFTDCKNPPPIIKAKDSIIAIDAPCSCRRHKDKRRKCEELLGIAGYFETPYDRKMAKPWMISGFDLWTDLLRRGFKRAISVPVKKNSLIEVHPTIIFKSIVNPKVHPRLWISRRHPLSKRSLTGRSQRKDILKNKKFPCLIDNLNIDYIDALIAAYTAEQAYKANARTFGDPQDGYIFIPVK
jgi:predicted nuclease with RNAse H fold